MTDASSAAAALFESCGLDAKTALNVSRNAKLSATLSEVIAEAGAAAGCGKAVGNLLYAVAAKARALTAPPPLAAVRSRAARSFREVRCATERR